MKSLLLVTVSPLVLLIGAPAHAQGAPAASQPASAPAAAPVDAAAPASAAPAEDDEEVIVVLGQRPRGSVPGVAIPIQTLGPAEIRSFGASNVTELLAALAPQTGSARGQARGGGGGPVILLNGRRISGFAEVRNLPPEAIERVEVLPEEVALQFGFSADQRVVNFVLRERFSAVTAEVGGGRAAGGGQGTSEIEFNRLQIDRGGRFSVNGEIARDSRITEAERDVLDPAGLGETAVRSLFPDRRQIDLGLNVNRGLSPTTGATFDLRFGRGDTNATLGRAAPGVAGSPVLERDVETTTGRAALTFDGSTDGWQWTASAAWDRSETRTETDQRAGATSTARSTVDQFELVANANGVLAELPAGPMRTALRLGVQERGLDAVATRDGVETATDLSRTDVTGRATLTVPVASRRREVLDRFGDVTVSGNVAATELSDFGGLINGGVSLNWSPIADIRISASHDWGESAPSVEQLGNPVVVTPQVAVFDFATGRTAFVTSTTGGDATLIGGSSRTLSASINWSPQKVEGLELSASWSRNTAEDQPAGFPGLTPDLEAAFPGRFTRDATGALIAVDRRPINIAERETEVLRLGLSYSKGFGRWPQRPDGTRGPPQGFGGGFGAGGARPGRPQGAGADGGRGGPAAAASTEGRAAQAGAAAPGATPDRATSRPPGSTPPAGGAGMGPRGPGGGPPGAGGGGRGGFGGFPGMGGPGGGTPGRWSASVFHVTRLVDTATLRAGLPALDFLDGDALGQSGVARQAIEFEGGLFYMGQGFRLFGNWEGESRVDGVVGPSGTTTSLTFEPVFTVNMRAFANLGAISMATGRAPWLRRARLVLRVDNLTDTVQKVRDSTGATPIAFQPGFQSARGRFVELSLRKQF